MKLVINIAVLFFAFSCLSIAFDKSDSTENEIQVVTQDSADRETQDTSAISVFQMKKSTWQALAFTIIPGGGQIYVESYWKAPLFFGAAVFLGYLIYDNDKKFAVHQERYNYLVCYLRTDKSDYNVRVAREKKEFYRNLRDRSAFYLLGVYVLAAVDAYVGVHLYDFDVSDNFSMNIVPNFNGGVSVNFSYRLQ